MPTNESSLLEQRAAVHDKLMVATHRPQQEGISIYLYLEKLDLGKSFIILYYYKLAVISIQLMSGKLVVSSNFCTWLNEWEHSVITIDH